MPQDIHDPAFVAEVFDRCAQGYRSWSEISSFGFISRWRKQCIRALPKTDVANPVAVDLMAGTGEIWPVFLKHYPDVTRIVAIDISHQMHLHAVERLHSGLGKNIEHMEADFLDNSLPADMADCAISSFGLKTLNHVQQAIFAKEVARILKKGGVFSFIEASDPKGWILRPAYRLYLDRILPLIERFFLKGAQDFSMLGTYTRSFGDCTFMASCLANEGLEVKITRYFFGCATGVSGCKPKTYSVSG